MNSDIDRTICSHCGQSLARCRCYVPRALEPAEIPSVATEAAAQAYTDALMRIAAGERVNKWEAVADAVLRAVA